MTTTNHRPVDSTTRACCHGIGRHTPNCLESSELIEGIHGSWLGRRGIFRHSQPSAEDAIVVSKACGHPVSHVMSTAVSGEFSGEVVGELIRWADGDDDSITFEARIDGTPDSAGMSDIAAYSYEDILALAKVSNDLRYEWAAILEGRRRVTIQAMRSTGGHDDHTRR